MLTRNILLHCIVRITSKVDFTLSSDLYIKNEDIRLYGSVELSLTNLLMAYNMPQITIINPIIIATRAITTAVLSAINIKTRLNIEQTEANPATIGLMYVFKRR